MKSDIAAAFGFWKLREEQPASTPTANSLANSPSSTSSQDELALPKSPEKGHGQTAALALLPADGLKSHRLPEAGLRMPEVAAQSNGITAGEEGPSLAQAVASRDDSLAGADTAAVQVSFETLENGKALTTDDPAVDAQHIPTLDADVAREHHADAAAASPAGNRDAPKATGRELASCGNQPLQAAFSQPSKGVAQKQADSSIAKKLRKNPSGAVQSVLALH